MTEERRAAPVPTAAEAVAAAPELDVTPLPEETLPRLEGEDAGPPPPLRDSSPGVRRRGRMTLRIPDDEVSRPKGAVMDAAPALAHVEPSPPMPAPAAVLVPMRIISISETPPPPAPPVEVISVEADAEEADDTEVTPVPFQGTARSVAPVAPVEVNVRPVAPVESVESVESVEPVESVESIVADDTTQPFLPQVPSTPNGVALEPEDEEIRFEDDALTPAIPRAELADASERISDPGDAPEISVEDVVAIEAAPAQPRLGLDLPPMRARSPSQPPAVPLSKAPAAPKSKPPLVIVPPHVGSVQPQYPDSSVQRRKGRLWWEELFNEDYLRTVEKLTDRQVAREATFIEESLGIERGGAVLDLACGTGRQAIELARRGYEVVGFDLSLAMLARAGDEAQSRSVKMNFVQGDMREMIFEEQFDGVYCWNTSFGYFDEEKNAQVVDRVHHGLKAGGLFLLDVVNRDFIQRQSPSLAWFEGDGCVCMDEMTVDFITSRMRVKRTLMLDDGRSREIEYSMRVYSLHELGKILHDHGFKVCEVSGRLATPGVFFGNESPRTIILAEKK